jgi:hypothetical protein
MSPDCQIIRGHKSDNFSHIKLSKILKVSLDRDKEITYQVNIIDTLIIHLNRIK